MVLNTLGINTYDQKHLDKQEISIVENKQQHEFKLVGSTKKVAGHTLFSFNTETKELKKAEIQKSNTYNAFTKQSAYKDKVVIERNCFYFWSLNEKNALKKLRKAGFIK